MTEEDEAACVRRDRKGGKLFPAEVVLYDSDPTVTISANGSAESMATALFEELVKRFSVEGAEDAFRAVLKGQKPHKAGRRKGADSIALDDGLLREYRREYDRLTAQGKSPDQARAKAMTCVANKFSCGPAGFSMASAAWLPTASALRRRLFRLVKGK